MTVVDMMIEDNTRAQRLMQDQLEFLAQPMNRIRGIVDGRMTDITDSWSAILRQRIGEMASIIASLRDLLK